MFFLRRAENEAEEERRAVSVDSTRFVSIVAALYAPPQRKLQPPLKSQRFSTSLH